MSKKIEGPILSTQLGEFGEKRMKYGFISIENQDKEHIRVKIDSYTEFGGVEAEKLSIGLQVVAEVDKLGNTDVIHARKISIR
jgi:hypothetical protein